jgi:ubiquinone/menaquinone biosynthesis C-methylase UbiE
MPFQKKAFLTTEGDKYFLRNSAALTGYLDSPVLQASVSLYSRYLQPRMNILEIGCAAGAVLSRFQAIGCNCYGIDPSAQAIECGRKLYPEIDFTVGTADALPYPDSHFDFVLFGFCLYLVDRELLPRTIAEADRVLCPRGFVGITDFDPPRPCQRPYKHCREVLSYKMDYSALFAVYPQYVLVDKLSLSHSSDRFTIDPAERVSAVILCRDPENAYRG